MVCFAALGHLLDEEIDARYMGMCIYVYLYYTYKLQIQTSKLIQIHANLYTDVAKSYIMFYYLNLL